ncbi:HK97-gp10 family putative phage morphogenesis protein [Moraxella sp. ZJ142]|uniref:HK97-gp10 family putative phage morphogenesis protein n=1 Tax=Moraxella marmotae TaxID=3344520 RepID=UPI0035D47152
MKFSVKVEGLDELDKQLAKLDNQTTGKALYAALNYSSNPMQKDMKDRAPKAAAAYRRYMSHAQGEKTWVKTKNGKPRAGKSKRATTGTGKYIIQQPGLLKSSVRKKRLNKNSQNEHQAALGIFIAQGTGKTFGSPYYWYFIEYGTKYMPAIPFVRPAYEQGKHLVVERFKQNLDKNIKKHSR